MTDSYSWEWLSPSVALKTVLRPMKVEDALALESAMAGHHEGKPGGRPWGLVIDLRNAGVASVDVQDVLKRVMRADVGAGCTAIAFVATKTVVHMQTARLTREAEHAPSAMFDTVADAVSSVESRLGAGA